MPAHQPGPGRFDPERLPRVEEEDPMPIEDDAPRRAASARFVVDGTVGTEAAMREAMDPANQSLAEALRLSFRVLQVVILVLIVLFLASGFQTVKDGQSGVTTVWGRISSADGEQALTTGPKFGYPYPAGEFILFDVENRFVDLGEWFMPASRNRTREQMLESAAISNPLTPGRHRDGSLVTRDGELAHMELAARYVIEQPVRFVETINDSVDERDADRIVSLALQRAAVHAAAGMSADELIDESLRDDTSQRIRQKAQEVLDELECGVRIETLTTMRGSLPLAIEKSSDEYQAMRVAVDRERTEALQKASETLTRTAGAKHEELSALIEQYEDALDARQEPESAQLLEAINHQLESSDTTGEVSTIIQSAQGYRSQVQLTLGAELDRFRSLLPAYRENPQLLVRQQWLESIASVMNQRDVEIIYLDPGMNVRLALSGSAEVQQIRRDAFLKRKEDQANMAEFDPNDPRRYLYGADMTYGRSGRQLEIDRSSGGSSLRPSGMPR